LKPGDKVVFKEEGNVVRIRRASPSILAGYGAVTPRSKPEDCWEIRQEFERGVPEETGDEA